MRLFVVLFSIGAKNVRARSYYFGAWLVGLLPWWVMMGGHHRGKPQQARKRGRGL